MGRSRICVNQRLSKDVEKEVFREVPRAVVDAGFFKEVQLGFGLRALEVACKHPAARWRPTRQSCAWCVESGHRQGSRISCFEEVFEE